MKVLYFIFLISANLIAETKVFCPKPISISGRVVLIEVEDPEPTQSKTFKKAKEVTKQAVGVSNVLSTVTALTTTQVAQGSRSLSLSALVSSCGDDSSSAGEKLSWTENPTQLSIGNSTLKYELGATLGNWASMGGIVGTWGLIALKFGAPKAKYPGGVILPALFLLTPTVSSSIKLLKSENLAEQFLGGCSLVAQTVGVVAVGAVLSPKHFAAQWNPAENKWIDTNNPGYVSRYKMLFKDFSRGQQGFISAELLMSIASGIISSFQATDTNCRALVSASAGTALTYASSILLLRPHNSKADLIFFGTIASAQALALTSYSIVLWSGSEYAKSTAKTVTEYTLIICDGALFIKSLFDLGKRVYLIYNEYYSSATAKPTSLEEPMLANFFEDKDNSNTEPESISINTALIELEEISLTTTQQIKPLPNLEIPNFDYLPEGWIRDAAIEQARAEAEAKRLLDSDL